MPKTPSTSPRSRQFLLRFTEQEADVLEAQAFLNRTTPTEEAAQVVRSQISVWASNERIGQVLVQRAAQDAESAGTLTSIRRRPQQPAG